MEQTSIHPTHLTNQKPNKMKPLDIYDDMPSSMKRYISNYGWHFNKKACDYAVSLMKKWNATTGKKEPIEPTTKEKVEEVLTANNVKLKNAILYDHVFVYNMARSDYYKSSIPDEAHLALFVKDYIDDVDVSDETTFRRWLATMVGNGQPIEWDDIF